MTTYTPKIATPEEIAYMNNTELRDEKIYVQEKIVDITNIRWYDATEENWCEIQKLTEIMLEIEDSISYISTHSKQDYNDACIEKIRNIYETEWTNVTKSIWKKMEEMIEDILDNEDELMYDEEEYDETPAYARY